MKKKIGLGWDINEGRTKGAGRGSCKKEKERGRRGRRSMGGRGRWGREEGGVWRRHKGGWKKMGYGGYLREGVWKKVGMERT
jgi:hypothetical protein